MIRRTLTWLAVGIALGLLASMWFGPELIRWWWQPPGGANLLSCDPYVRTATIWLVRIQLIAGGVMGVFLAIVANLIAARRRRAKVETAPPPAKTQA